jgi:protein phosphatase
MGGLEEGELASKTALSAFFRALSDGMRSLDAVREANAAVMRVAKGRHMGTTLVAAILTGRELEVVSIGDSRAYLSDPLGLIQITRDHTLAEEASRSGLLSDLEVEEDDNRWGGALARYLGGNEEAEPDRFGPMEMVDNGWLVLSSDGMHGVLSADEIDAFLGEASDVESAAVGLVEKALMKGTQDNVSVALAYCPRATVGTSNETSADLDSSMAPGERRLEEDDPGEKASTAPSRNPFPFAPSPPPGRRSDAGRILIRHVKEVPGRGGSARRTRLLLVLVPVIVIALVLMNWIL